MVGIAGGDTSVRDLETVRDPLCHESWYETDAVAAGQYSIARLAHDDPAPETWTDGDRIGALHGHVDPGLDALFPALFDDPEGTLAGLDGPFVLAAADADADRVLLATDKMATTPCYYATVDGFAFATEVKGAVAAVDDPTPDAEAVADLLATEFVWGDKTLVAEVSAVPPASVLEFDGDGIDVSRYWTADFDAPGDYVRTLVDRYRDAVTDVTDGAGEDVTMMLSGGLDSRALAACLAEHSADFQTFTYDANPAGGENVRSARRVADLLGVENELIEFTPDGFVDVLERGISLADGLAPWIHYHNLPFTLKRLRDRTDLLINVSGQGEFFGEDILRHRVTGPRAIRDIVYEAAIPDRRSETALGGLLQQYGHLGQSEVDDVLAVETDVAGSIRTELDRSRTLYDSREERILDAVHRNFYPNFHFKSNAIERSQTTVRTPFADGDLLDAVAGMPLDYRRRIPQVTSELKLDVVREFDCGIENIAYERTNTAPTKPLALHTARHFADSILPSSDSAAGSRPLIFTSELLQGLFGAGRYSMYGAWYRDHDELGELVGRLVEDACDRDLFDATTLRELDREHRAGESDHIGVIAVVTTVESWFQQHLD